ncbi:hypothetical protein [Oecophyllibacter saccharovorans]|uniref:Uncharacterized protein n=1 Tax=Oecophyllibacter saccharovorans TaxID=2558360 RepID=A0A506UKG8_9PROT|nr:hypothetical protein [Oecophyllibacter saccharovorans]TPW33829.1 hypothetical protein E3202_04325 [Oecophyllibacter saccharovorans]
MPAFTPFSDFLSPDFTPDFSSEEGAFAAFEAGAGEELPAEALLTDLPLWELNTALRGLYLAEHDPDLVQRAYMIACMDGSLAQAEQALLQQALAEEHLPARPVQQLAAQSEAWLVYVSEMLRTWRGLLHDIDRLAVADALESEIRALGQPRSARSRAGRRLHLLQLAHREQDLRERIQEALDRTQDIVARIEALRESLERGEAMEGECPRLSASRNISPESGAVTWVLYDEADQPVLRLSRRAVAEMLRLMDAD